MLIKELAEKENMSVILITHDFKVIEEICNKVIVMYEGKIVEREDVQTICKHPSHSYTQLLLYSAEVIEWLHYLKIIILNVGIRLDAINTGKYIEEILLEGKGLTKELIDRFPGELSGGLC